MALIDADTDAVPEVAQQGPTDSAWIFGLPGDKPASYGGDGIEEALEVIRALEKADIPCCIGGIHALQYFGAGRVPDLSFSLLTIPILFILHLRYSV
jgi:hypothetical protein